MEEIELEGSHVRIRNLFYGCFRNSLRGQRTCSFLRTQQHEVILKPPSINNQSPLINLTFLHTGSKKPEQRKAVFV